MNFTFNKYSIIYNNKMLTNKDNHFFNLKNVSEILINMKLRNIQYLTY